jgi:homoserine kinase
MATWPAGPVTVQVPATSANLGPGFDSLGLALSLHNTVTAVVRPGDTEVESFDLWPGSQPDVTEDNLILRAMRAGFAALGGPQPPGIAISCRNEVPQGFGLGSSAAAIVSGILAARALAGPDGVAALPDADMLRLATEIEGHPDNVSAAIDGGFVICAQDATHRFEPPMGLEAVLVIPDTPVRTAQARAALPATVPIADAVFNVAAAATLTLGLATGSWDLIAAGLSDRLHQPHRAHLYPRSAELLEHAAEYGALGATISGAGPTVLVWCTYEQTGAVIERLKRTAEGWADVLRAPFESQGADVSEL